MRDQVSGVCFHSHFGMGTVLSAAMSVAERHVQDFTGSLFEISCIIWSRNTEAWLSLPGLKMCVRERLKNEETPLVHIWLMASDRVGTKTVPLWKQWAYRSAESRTDDKLRQTWEKDAFWTWVSVWYAVCSFCYCNAKDAVMVCSYGKDNPPLTWF